MRNTVHSASVWWWSHKAMDQFVTPLKEHKTKAPDAAKVKAAYNLSLEKLKPAD